MGREDAQRCLRGWHSPCPPLGAATAVKDEQGWQDVGTAPCPACRLWPILPLISVISKPVVCSQCSSQVCGTSAGKRKEGGASGSF